MKLATGVAGKFDSTRDLPGNLHARVSLVFSTRSVQGLHNPGMKVRLKATGIPVRQNTSAIPRRF
jgi:hypothetical protein